MREISQQKIDKILKRKQNKYDKLENILKLKYLETAAFDLTFEQWCEECEDVGDLLDSLDEIETEIRVLRQWGK